MKRAIVGTAGHIDHGKTKLIEALTGIDCDRWAEEKRRGITIDLGFAHLEENGLQVGFVDVPGHERFLHNALAGLGGIRVMLLVVAADEGVKPQTREHLAICSLLEIPAAVVALTKTDVAPDDLVELARMETAELLATTPFAKAPIHPVSSLTGSGIAELRKDLLELAAAHAVEAAPGAPARLPVDRAFLLKGLGLVVTGTLAAGEISAGDTLDLGPEGPAVRVRGVQVHGASRKTARAGERTALQLTGVEHHQIERGDQLLAPGAFATTRTLLARFRLLPDAPKAIQGSERVRFHLLSTDLGARLRPLDPPVLEPGDQGLVEIRLASPVPAVVGDRWIARRPSPPVTLGGGRVLDPAWRPRKGKELEKALAALGGEPSDGLAKLLRLWIRQAGEAAIASAPMARRLGVSPEILEPELQALAGEQQALEVPAGHGHERRWLDPSAYRRVAERAQQILKGYFRGHRLAAGMPKAEAVERIFPGRAAELAATYLAWLESQKVLTVSGGKVNLPGRAAELSGEESELSAKLVAAFDEAALTPPAPTELYRRLGAKPKTAEGVLGYLIERRKLTRLPGGLIISTAALDRLAAGLRQSGWSEFSVGDFKDRFALSRKWAIPILEHLDSTGITRRVGDKRQVAGR